MNNHLEDFARLMWQEGIPENVIKTFAAYYNKLVRGESSKINRNQIKPPAAENLIDYQNLPVSHDKSILERIVVIKLNGGLGTSMGLSKAKSLLPVKGNLNFLDIIARQILTLRAEYGSDLHLVFMNSYNTRADTINYLGKYPDLAKSNVPLDFVQNKFPRILQSDLSPFIPSDPAQKWNPPGHGDIYLAMDICGILDKLLELGIHYAFFSNADNLGATLNESIPAYMADQGIPFLMEVCLRTEADKKGGHLSENTDGKLLLREIAQCPEDELQEFQDVERYKYFNTNNIWIDLRRLKAEMDNNEGMLLLPLIINPKTIDGIPIFQLETAMGAAISNFEGARALLVPRSRFAPVKKTTDLLALWSDAYELNDRYQMILKRHRMNPPLIYLDEKYYNGIDQLQKRFRGIPSLQNCDSFKVSGDVTFGEDVICKGNVSINSCQTTMIKDRICEGIINL